MFLKRYGNIDYILKMPADEALKQYNFVQNKEFEDRAFKIYLAKLSNSNYEIKLSFEEWLKVIKKDTDKQADNKQYNPEEIINRALYIKAVVGVQRRAEEDSSLCSE